jgi:hypothetical protein
MIAPRKKAPYPENVSLSKLLLVEGETPAHFFEALAVHVGVEKQVEIRSFGGITNFEDFLSALVKGHGFGTTVKSLGIIRDAELDADGAKKAIAAAVKNAKLPSHIPLKVYILPDNSKPGMIETLCLESIADKPHFPCVEEYITNAKSKGATFPGGLAIDKSRLQVYMAAHPEPQMFPGIAASRKFWPFADQIFSDLREFLKTL